MKNGQVTIKDIARALNISPSTVSRALKDHPDISQATKKIVNELASKLDYQPNIIAQSLRQSKSRMLGIVIPRLVHHFFSSIISGIEDIAHDHHYNLIITQSNESYLREVENVRTLLSSQVDGLLVSMTRETQDFTHFYNVEKKGIPLIFFDRACEVLNTHSVLVEDFQGAFMAVDHLIKTGCKQIVHLAGPENLRISKERLRGFCEAHQRNNLGIPDRLIVHADNRSKAYQVISQLIKEGASFDGIFTVNDDTAAGAMVALHEANISIPEQVSVVGFGNDPVSEITWPTLSSVGQPGFEMGQEVVKLFLEQSKCIDKEISFKPVKRLFTSELILRQSTRKLI